MNQQPTFPSTCTGDDFADALEWLARVLTNFARAEQAIGNLSSSLNLPIKNGLLGSLQQAILRLESAQDRRCDNLAKRIVRWRSLRPVRHLLAHATIRIVYDENGAPLVVTRHLPLDDQDVTPDRVWSDSERVELLRVVTNDGRSIEDQVKNLLNDKLVLGRLQNL